MTVVRRMPTLGSSAQKPPRPRMYTTVADITLEQRTRAAWTLRYLPIRSEAIDFELALDERQRHWSMVVS